MYYTREQHRRFLDKELEAISENYIRVLNTKATALLTENEVYVAQFMKVDLEKDTDSEDNFVGSGQVVLKLKKDKGIPRKNEYFTVIGEVFRGQNYADIRLSFLRFIAFGRARQMIMVFCCVALTECQWTWLNI